ERCACASTGCAAPRSVTRAGERGLARVAATDVVEAAELEPLELLVLRGGVVRTDLADEAAVWIEDVPLVAPEHGALVRLEVRPLDDGAARRGIRDHLVDRPHRAEVVDRGHPALRDPVGAAERAPVHPRWEVVDALVDEAGGDLLEVGLVARVEVRAD